MLPNNAKQATSTDRSSPGGNLPRARPAAARRDAPPAAAAPVPQPRGRGTRPCRRPARAHAVPGTERTLLGALRAARARQGEQNPKGNGKGVIGQMDPANGSYANGKRRELNGARQGQERLPWN